MRPHALAAARLACLRRVPPVRGLRAVARRGASRPVDRLRGARHHRFGPWPTCSRRPTDGLDAVFNNGAYAIPRHGRGSAARRAARDPGGEPGGLARFDATGAAGDGGRRATVGSSRTRRCWGLVAAPWRGAYVATKFALEGLNRPACGWSSGGSGIHVALIEARPRHVAVPRQQPHAVRAVDRLASLAAPRPLQPGSSRASRRPDANGSSCPPAAVTGAA